MSICFISRHQIHPSYKLTVLAYSINLNTFQHIFQDEFIYYHEITIRCNFNCIRTHANRR